MIAENEDREQRAGPDAAPDDRSIREIAVAVFGTERVAAQLHAGGWMRARVRRLAGRR